jgi:hypothetical protein
MIKSIGLSKMLVKDKNDTFKLDRDFIKKYDNLNSKLESNSNVEYI